MFNEVQRFSKWWMLVVGGSAVFPIAILIKEDATMQSLPFEQLELLIVLLFQLLLVLLFAMLKLTVQISSDGVDMRFFPLFAHKSFSWDDVQHAEVVDYGFVGGWGIRIWTRYGTVYNTKGSTGIKFQLKNGKHFLIGTQQPEEWERLLNTHWKS